MRGGRSLSARARSVCSSLSRSERAPVSPPARRTLRSPHAMARRCMPWLSMALITRHGAPLHSAARRSTCGPTHGPTHAGDPLPQSALAPHSPSPPLRNVPHTTRSVHANSRPSAGSHPKSHARDGRARSISTRRSGCCARTPVPQTQMQRLGTTAEVRRQLGSPRQPACPARGVRRRCQVGCSGARSDRSHKGRRGASGRGVETPRLPWPDEVQQPRSGGQRATSPRPRRRRHRRRRPWCYGAEDHLTRSCSYGLSLVSSSVTGS